MLLELFFLFFNILPIKIISLTLKVLSFLSSPLPSDPTSLSLYYLCYLLFGSFSNVQRYSISMIHLQMNEDMPENMTRELKCELHHSPQFSFPCSRVQELLRPTPQTKYGIFLVLYMPGSDYKSFYFQSLLCHYRQRPSPFCFSLSFFHCIFLTVFKLLNMKTAKCPTKENVVLVEELFSPLRSHSIHSFFFA